MTDENSPPDNIKSDIDAARERIKSRMAKTAQDIIEIGRDLANVKKLLSHGEFQEWIQTELGISPRTAQNFMNVTNRLGGKSEMISLLPPTVVYALAAPSTPDDVRAHVLELAEKGGPITEQMV
jgi:hypothetical protein